MGQLTEIPMWAQRFPWTQSFVLFVGFLLLAAGRSGDTNLDGAVDVTDLLGVISAWGTCPDLPVDCPADIDGNGVVDVSDLLSLIADWS